MRISTKDFFSHYITECFSRELTYNQRVKCLALSILLVPFTLGIAHLIGYIWSKYRISHLSNKRRIFDENKKRFDECVNNTDRVFKSIISNKPSIEIDQSEIPILADDILREHYGQPYPKNEDAKVNFNGQEVFWSSLSNKDKIQVLKDHGKLNGTASNYVPDQLFYGSTTNQFYLSTDPRVSHGKDHAMRTAIFALVFAYLYNKYQGVELTEQDLIEIQLAALFHDSGRITDGVDLWDEQSAQNAEDFLENSLNDESIETISEAIKTQKDTLAGKCLQNADSVEYARLLLKAPELDHNVFAYSRVFLSITTDGIEDDNFIPELDSLRHEMNQLIWETRQKSVRKELSESDNYYQSFLKKINKQSYPSLHYILRQLKIKSPPEQPIPEPNLLPPFESIETNPNNNYNRIKELDQEIIQLCENDHTNAAVTRKLIEAGLTNVWMNNPQYDPSIVLSDPKSDIKIRFAGGGCVRKRRIRYAKTERGFQITFELPSKIREQWGKKRKLLKLHKVEDQKWGKLWQYSEDDIDISIGRDKNIWNSYHFVRMEMDMDITPKAIHQALCSFGLPTAFIPDQEEDLTAEANARMKAIKIESFSPYQIFHRDGEMINPILPITAWRKGARAFMAFVNGGDIANTSKVVASIAKNGLLSAQERLLRGIEGGNNTDKLWKAGSANQVFTRILMKKHFENQVESKAFAVDGLVMVLLNINLFEKIPYSYIDDKMGVRNPNYDRFHYAQKQFPRQLNGEASKNNRPGFDELLDELSTGDHLLNESMFDWSIPPYYIDRFVVANEFVKTAIMEELHSSGIEQLNGKPVEDLVIVADRLNPSMIEKNNYDYSL
jgi:HD superfamily phosphodiesterase